MKPNPFASLNHFTVPLAICDSFAARLVGRGWSGALLREVSGGRRRDRESALDRLALQHEPLRSSLEPISRGANGSRGILLPPKHRRGRRPAPPCGALAAHSIV